MSESILKEEEKISYALRSLYRDYGYLSYKMSKFEKYDLYVKNKEFLVGDGVITFNDTNGKLLALKPDVTLSIIKNDADENGKRKVCYNENVYRISGKTKQFKELMQAGLECIGDLDMYDVYETVYLAAGSLALVSPNFVLDISDLGILSAILSEVSAGDKFDKEIMQKIAEKNVHEIEKLCLDYGVDQANAEKLKVIATAYGKPSVVLKKLKPICVNEEAKLGYERLSLLTSLLEKSEYGDRIRIDFSVVNDMNYYSDIVFKGFIAGIGEGVLSGGRYDKLLTRMGRKSGGIGFAVYLDLLEGFGAEKRGTDVDVLVLYDEKTDVKELIAKVQELVQAGNSVRAQKSLGNIRYKQLIQLSGGGK